MQARSLWMPGMIAMAGLIGVSGFFSASETALFFLPPEKVDRFRSGKGRERMIATLLSDPDRLLTAILFANLVVNLLFFAVSVIIAGRLTRHDFPIAAAAYGLTSLFGIILMGEVVPKSLAVTFPAGFAKLIIVPLAIAVRVLDPIIPFFRQIAISIRRLRYPELQKEVFLSGDDLERMLEAITPAEGIGSQERDLLQKLVELSDIKIEEIMWPREDLVLHSPPVELSDLPRQVPNGGYVLLWSDAEEIITRAVPLYEMSSTPDGNLECFARPVTIVPWCLTVAQALQQLQRDEAVVACVVDEYGDLIGIVTEEDLMETLLLRLPSRTRRILRREPVIEIAPGKYHVEGLTTLRHFAQRMDIQYEPEADGPLTVGGMLQDELDRLPQLGDETEWNGWSFRVIARTVRGNLRAMATRVPAKEESESSSGEDE